MIRAIIIDDEQHCIQRLNQLIATHCASQVHVMEVAENIEDAEKLIYKLQPSLVFLDVQIQDKTGFDLLTRIPKRNFEVIFTTAFDKYAVQAFKFSAIDYLLKPIDADELKEAVNKVAAKPMQNQVPEKMETLLHNIKNLQAANKRICIPTVNGLLFIQVNDILYCQGEANYTHIHLLNKQKILVAKTLKEYEELLADCNFFRIHNSHLINLAYIKSYNRGKGGSVTLTNGAELEVSTRRKDDFLKRLGEM